MACEQDGIVFKKPQNLLTHGSGEDPWDDSALIKAYDKAVAQLKGESPPASSDANTSIVTTDEGKRKKKKKKGKRGNKKVPSWSVGCKCQAIYSEDGLYYPATILSLEARTAYVKFDEYGNEEEVAIGGLLPVERKVDLQTSGSERLPQDNLKKQSLNKNLKKVAGWSISDLCYAPCDADYEQAVINAFVDSSKCIVTFVKNGRKKETPVCLLQSKANTWKGMQNSMHQPPTTGNATSNFWSLPQTSQFPGHPSFPPCFPGRANTSIRVPPIPPPPILSSDSFHGDEEALANMLMSWYMSGYHTGYYQGKKEQQQKES